MKKVILLMLIGGIFFSLGLTTQAQDDEAVTLTVWGDPGGNCINDPDNDWSFCAFSRMLDRRWQELHPNIHLNWVLDKGWDDDLRVNLLNAIEAGEEPDITIGESFMPGFTAQGLYLPLTMSDEFKANLIPATIQAVTYEGEIYGVGVYTGIFTLEVNADVLLANGYTLEQLDLSTWEAVLQVATDISASGNYYGYSILGPTNFPAAALFRVAPYMYQAGADFCVMPECDIPTLNDPKAVPVYQWFRDLYAVSDPAVTFSGDEAYVFSQLFAGSVAMQTAGSWHIAWAKSSGCLDCRYLPLPLAENGERANVVVGNAIYAALATTEHPEEAMLFLEFLGSPEIQNAVFWTGGVGRLPTTYSALEAIAFAMTGDTSTLPAFYTEELQYDLADAPAEAQRYAPFFDELLNGSPRTLPPWKPELSALWNEMFAEILQTDRPIPAILDDYQARAEDLVK